MTGEPKSEIEQRDEWVKAYVSRLWNARLERLTLGTHFQPLELYNVLRSARDEMAVSILEKSLTDDPSSLKPAIQAFKDLDAWVDENGGKSSVKAPPVSQADLHRVEQMLRKARGLTDA